MAVLSPILSTSCCVRVSLEKIVPVGTLTLREVPSWSVIRKRLPAMVYPVWGAWVCASWPIPGGKVHRKMRNVLFSSTKTHTGFPFHPAWSGSGSLDGGSQEKRNATMAR